jgi:coproporphyrinogen III oxidase-like Fe-S oxidoreductase
VAIMDEVHDTMNPTKSHLFPAIASKSTIKQSDTIFLFDFIYNLPNEIISSIQKNTQDQMPADELKRLITKCVKDKYLKANENHFNVPANIRDDFADFLCEAFDGQDKTNPEKHI